MLGYNKRQLNLAKEKLKSQSRVICWKVPRNIQHQACGVLVVSSAWHAVLRATLLAALVGQPTPDMCCLDHGAQTQAGPPVLLLGI